MLLYMLEFGLVIFLYLASSAYLECLICHCTGGEVSICLHLTS